MIVRTLIATLALLGVSCGGAGTDNAEPPRADTVRAAGQAPTSPSENDAVSGGPDADPTAGNNQAPDRAPGNGPTHEPDPTPDPDPMLAADPTNRTERRTDWPRGLDWVRNNDMFVSGLTVQMDGVSANFVNAYYDDFGANAIHLWQTGLPNRLVAWLNEPRRDHRWLTWLDRDGTPTGSDVVAGGMPPDAPGRIGYQVGDEPRTLNDFSEMVVGVDAVRAHDPNALVFLNMTLTADQLDQMMSDQCNDNFDVISYDDYSMRQGSYEWLEYFRNWGLNCDKPYWRYINSYSEPGREFPKASGMRWHAMVGLLYGFTGHSWFLYQITTAHNLGTAFFHTTGAINSPRTPLFDVAADINRKLKNYGRIVARLESTDVRYVSSLGGVAQPTNTTSWAAGAGNDPYLVNFEQAGSVLQDGLIGFFEDNYGERYIMLQNPNHEGGSFPVSTDDDATFTLTFDFSNAPAAGFDRNAIEHFSGETGQIADVALASNQLQVTLPAGEVYLFKYSTGSPWDTL